MIRAVVGLAALTVGVAMPGLAQGSGLPPASRSVRDGVYTAPQAARGQDTYAGMCQGCHTPGSHRGPAFLNAWGGRELWELFAYIRDLMPKNEPGILTPEECAQLVAYLLRMNGLPAGETELPPDSAALSAIRLELGAASVRAPGPR